MEPMVLTMLNDDMERGLRCLEMAVVGTCWNGISAQTTSSVPTAYLSLLRFSADINENLNLSNAVCSAWPTLQCSSL